MTDAGATPRDLVIAAIVDERVAVARFAQRQAGEIAEMLGRRECSADEATQLTERMRAFAGQIATGIHTGGDAAEVRRAVRAGLIAAGLRFGGAW